MQIRTVGELRREFEAHMTSVYRTLSELSKEIDSIKRNVKETNKIAEETFPEDEVEPGE